MNGSLSALHLQAVTPASFLFSSRLQEQGSELSMASHWPILFGVKVNSVQVTGNCSTQSKTGCVSTGKGEFEGLSDNTTLISSL